MVGKTISHYKILKKLGSGGMGLVYKAEDTKLNRFVALKILPLHLIQTEIEKRRFIHEAKTASALDHPNVCTIYEIDETEDGQMFIAMAYYEGETLKEKIERGPWPFDETVNIAIQIGQGLLRAHGKGIIHRDIKPANIMITHRSEVKIVDFGLAKLAGQTKLTKSGTSLGTVAYMSPEQARGSTVDHRTDIYALGVVLYEMVTGQQPFKGHYEQAVVYSILNEDPEPIGGLRPDMPQGLQEIVTKAMSKSPDERFLHMDEMLADLKALKESHHHNVQIRTRPIKEKSLKKQHTLIYVGVAALLILLIAIRFLFTDGSVSKVLDSIAVLPLDNLSADPNQEYFADGMTEALIAELAQISSLRVISRSSVMQYKGKRPPVTEIAQQLDVAAIVEGSVFQDGQQVRITAQLIDAETDQHLLAKSYERDLRNILAMQSEVARAIVKEIRISLSKDEETHLESSRAVDPAAHEAYLRGQYNLQQFMLGGGTPEQIRTSVDYFQKAIALDPDWALAYAGLARAYHWLAGFGPSYRDFYAKSKAEALKALEIDETLSDAHASLSLVLHRYDWDWVGAERELRRAIEFDPNSNAWRAGLFFWSAGQYEEAIRWYKRAEERNPLSVIVKAQLGSVYTCAGQYDNAIRKLRNALDFDSTSAQARVYLAHAYLRKSMYDPAVTEVQKALALGESASRLALLGYAYAVSGRRGEALELLNQLQRKDPDHYSVALMALFIALGKKDEALMLLQKAYENRSLLLLYIRCSTVFDSLKDNPDFQKIINRVNFPDLGLGTETGER